MSVDEASVDDVYRPTLLTGMLSAVYWLDDAVRQTQEALGLQSWTRAQGFLIINVLFGERRANRLAKRLGVSRQAVGRLIGELVQVGVLTAEPDPDDARALRVDISPATAAASGNATVAVVHAMEDYLSRRLGAERLQAVREFLQMDWGPPPTLSSADVNKAVDRHKKQPRPIRSSKRELPHQPEPGSPKRSRGA